MKLQAPLTIATGSALIVGALNTYDNARERFDRDAIQATSTGCLERQPCPTPLLDTVPTLILAASGIALIAVAAGAILFACTPRAPPPPSTHNHTHRGPQVGGRVNNAKPN